MKIKKFFSLIFLIIFIFTLTGCMEKNSINSDRFISISKKDKLNVYNVTDQYKKSPSIKKGYVAANLRGWKVEFYELKDSDSAEEMFDKNKAAFEKDKTDKNVDASSNIRNYNTYSLTTSVNYYYLSRIDNTLLYVKVELSHKNSVKKFIDKLGY